jgi:hypothetical protein
MVGWRNRDKPFLPCLKSVSIGVHPSFLTASNRLRQTNQKAAREVVRDFENRKLHRYFLTEFWLADAEFSSVRTWQ